MRKEKSIKNAIISSIMNIVTIFAGFITQKIFIITLGKEYLGLNGLFSNILSMLSIAELGFGSAIVYHLYKPVAENNFKEINALVNFYKKAYNIISSLIFIIGLALTPCLSFIVGDININCNIYFLFFLSLLDVVVSYLLTYKRSILYANQQNYIINIIHIGYVILMNSFEIIFLLLFKNFTLYLLIKIIFRLLENILINVYVNKNYSYLKERKNNTIDRQTKKDILKKVKGLLFHKIGRSIVLSTDNIIISKFLGIGVVGLYSNYYMIINSVNNLFGQIFSSIAGAVGNLLVSENKNKSYNIYKSILLVNSWIYCLSSMLILTIIQPFIEFWIGKKYILSINVVIILIINFYIQGIEKTNILFKEAGGIFYEDRFIPIVEAIVNIVMSIIFVKIFGLFGVFLGTLFSTFVLYIYSYPKYVYMKIFEMKWIAFYVDLSKHLLIFLSCLGFSLLLIKYVSFNSLIIQIVINGMISFILVNLIYYLFYSKSNELKYFAKLFKKNKYNKRENNV